MHRKQAGAVEEVRHFVAQKPAAVCVCVCVCQLRNGMARRDLKSATGTLPASSVASNHRYYDLQYGVWPSLCSEIYWLRIGTGGGLL